MLDFKNELYSYSEGQPFKVGWYFKNLMNLEELQFNGKERFSAASTRKVPVLMAALSAIDQGKFELNQLITLSEKYQKNRSGCFRFLRPDIQLTLKDALTMMIIVSDNTCTAAVFDLIGLDYVNSYLKQVGLKNTEIKAAFPPLGMESSLEYKDVMSPADAGLILDLIYAGSLGNSTAITRLNCSKEHCQLALKILHEQMLQNRLPYLLPSEASVAHKTGTRLGVHNDIGIIYNKGKPLFILAAFTENESPGSDEKIIGCHFIAELCRKFYDSLV